MVTNPLLRPLGIAAAAIGIVQGLTWTILTLLAILIHQQAWEPEFDGPLPTHGESLSFILVIYLVDNTELPYPGTKDVYVNSSGLFAWSIVYLILSILWTALSSALLWVLIHEKYDRLKKVCLGWAVCTGIICVCDLILASLLASDYDSQVTATNKLGMFNFAALACGVLMTLAARGFVLWIVNLTFVVLLAKLSNGLTEETQSNGLNNNAAGTFGGATGPNHGIGNSGYNWDDDQPNFPRSNFFASPSPQGYKPPPQNYPVPPALPSPQGYKPPPQNYPVPPPKPNHNDRGAMSPPYNVAPPKPSQNYIYPTQPRLPRIDYSSPQNALSKRY